MPPDSDDTVLTDAQIDALGASASAEGAAPAATDPPPAEPAPTEQPPEEPAPREPAPSEPAPKPPPAEPADDKGTKWDGMSQIGQLPKRFLTTHLNPLQRETIRLTTLMPNLDVAEVAVLAKKNLGIETQTNGHATTEGEGAPPAAETLDADPLAVLERDLAEVDAKLLEAAEADGVGSTFNAEVKGLLDKKQALLTERALAQRDARMGAAVEANRFEAANQQSIADAQAAYPDIENPDSEFAKAVMERTHEVMALKRSVEADPSMLRDPNIGLRMAQWNHPNFPRMLADEVARERGVVPVSTAQSGQGTKAASTQGGPPAGNGAAPTAKPGLAPVMSGKAGAAHRGTVGESTPMDRYKVAAEAAIKNDDMEAFERALDELDTGGAGAGAGIDGQQAGRVIFVQ